MRKSTVFTVQKTVYLTSETDMLLEQMATRRGRDCNHNVLIREALQEYLESQSDIVGSRRHFQRSLQERIDQLEQRIEASAEERHASALFLTHIVIQLLSLGLAHLLSWITKQEVTPHYLIDQAMVAARSEEQILLEQIRRIRLLDIPEHE